MTSEPSLRDIRKITYAEAIQILIAAASRDVRGAGCGIRSLPSADEKASIRQAVLKVFKMAYGYEAQPSDLFNLGM